MSRKLKNWKTVKKMKFTEPYPDHLYTGEIPPSEQPDVEPYAGGTRFERPFPHDQQPLQTLGLLDVTRPPFSADSTGNIDCTAALNEAIAAGVKVVYVDSPANVEAEATFSTDNKAAGQTAGETMLAELEAQGITSGSIGIVNVNAATASTVAREEGFRAAFEGTDFELLETQYGEGDAAKSQSIAENYITQGVVGIFGCNEGSTTGAGNANKAADGSVIVVGFDKSDAILGLIEDGFVLATMAQNPDVMGYEGVRAAVAALNGEDLGGAVTDTGVSVLTK